MKLLKFLVAPVFLFALVGCEAVGDLRSTVRGYVAEKGNDYCDLKDEDLRNDVVDGLNERLRADGAKWTLRGIECDAPE